MEPLSLTGVMAWPLVMTVMLRLGDILDVLVTVFDAEDEDAEEMVDEGLPNRLSPLGPDDDEEVVEGWGEVPDEGEVAPPGSVTGVVLIAVTVLAPDSSTWGTEGGGDPVLTDTKVELIATRCALTGEVTGVLTVDVSASGFCL